MKPIKHESVTIYDLAKEAGVSPATVSRVLNKSAQVKQDKYDRVMELVEKYNFIPNAVAQGLSKKNTKTISIFLSDIRNPFYSTLCVEIENAAANCGYSTILCNTLNNPEIEYRYLEMMESKNVNAIFLLGGSSDYLSPGNVYCNLLNRVMEKIPVILTSCYSTFDTCRMVVDDRPGIESLLKYLISLGHKKFALIGGTGGVSPTCSKREIIAGILEENSLPQKEDWIIDTQGYSIEDGYRAGKEFFRRPLQEIPTAVIGVNEMISLGIIRAARQEGLRIPEDISVAGFDNTYLSEASIPTLTSVGCIYDSFGENAMKLVKMLAKDPSYKEERVIPCRLTIRDSCGANLR